MLDNLLKIKRFLVYFLLLSYLFIFYKKKSQSPNIPPMRVIELDQNIRLKMQLNE
jgi:hypothetical protein